MGLFDKIVNSIFNETKKAVDAVIPPTQKPAQNAALTPAPAPAPVQSAPQAPAYDPDAERIYREDGGYDFNDSFHRDAAYFRDILVRNFPGWTLEENVPITRFAADAHPKCIPVTFLMSNGGSQFAFFVMPINKTNGLPYKGSKEALKQAGIKTVHCIECYKNEESYVVNRIRNAM
ncbi:MAG: hypothetical protein J6S79_03835 [Lachnospiraceae bacterium]|nr:hypothetical protein [Lachnospiraceae bacterium]